MIQIDYQIQKEENDMHIKKYTEKDRYGNMFSYEFDVPSMQEIPQPDPSIFKPKGTDTVPAMLTPGENVVNAEASRLPGVQPMLDKLNDMGRTIQKKQGGPIPSYNAKGTKVEGKPAGKDTGMRTVTDKKVYETPDGYKVSEQRITVGDNTHGYGHVPSIYEGIQYEPQQVEQMLYRGQIPQPDMRFKTPTEADYYARLNSQNLMNFRDDASYLQEGGFVIDDTMLDAIKQVESGGDPNALSGVGAGGQYQIMPATAQQPGYGVTPISLEDRFDPNKSRTFAKQYLEGIMRANPDFTKDEVITAYHSGVGNVRKAKMGQEELGPRGQEYAGKVKMAMNENEVPMPEPRPAVFDDTPIESGFMSAQASTGDNEIPEPVDQDMYSGMNKREIQRFELGVDDDIIIDSDGSVQPVNPNRINKEIPKSLAEKLSKGIINQQQYDNQINSYNQSVKQNEAYKKFIASEKEAQDITNDIEINKEIKTIDDKIKEAENKNDIVLIEELTKRKAELQGKIKSQPKIDNKSLNTANQVVKQIDAMGYDEGKLTLDDADDAWAKKNLTGKYEGDFSQYLINKGKQVGGIVLDKSIEYFKGAFADMFDGEELARMALIYAGSRALGYDHLPSIKYGMKNYMKRVDANVAARKKFALSDKARDDFTIESLKKYSETGDINVLEAKPTSTGGITGTSGTRFDSVTGLQAPVYSIGTGDSKRLVVDVNGQLMDLADPKVRARFPVYNTNIHDSTKVTADFQKALDNQIKEINRGITDDDKKLDTSSDQLSLEAYNLYVEDRDKFRMNEKDSQQLKQRIFEAQRDYLEALKKAKANGTRSPTSIKGYYNKRTIKLKTKGIIDLNDVKNTDAEKLDIVNDTLYSVALKTADGNPIKAGTEYRKLWQSAKETWNNMKSHGSYVVDEETMKSSTKGYDPFILWLQESLLLPPEPRAEKLQNPDNMKK